MRTIRMTMLEVLMGALTAAALAGGCSIEPGAPDMPTYEAAVRPILMSHCVRCHGNPPLGDPTSYLYKGLDILQKPPTLNARFDVYSTECDTPVDGGFPADCIHGAAFEAPLIAGYLADTSPLPMPPPPAPPLTKHQVEAITRWAAEDPPLER